MLKSIYSSLRNINYLKNMSTVTQNKSNLKYIGTHNGVFHCDDVTACMMLRNHPKFAKHQVIRTRDPDLLAGADIVVDVGGEFDANKLRLDHHQRSFNLTIKHFHPSLSTTNPNAVKLSSAGLTYALFGKDILSNRLLGKLYNDELNDEQKKMIDAMFDKAYVDFIEEIDGIDNGFEPACGQDTTYNYHISTGISSRVARINPKNKDASDEERLSLFHKAMDMVEIEFLEGIEYLGDYWWPLRQEFKQCVEKRHEVDPSGYIVHLKGDLISWKSNLFEIEKELGIEGQLKYVIYHDNGSWRATCVPVSLKSFNSRLPLKEEWRGLRDAELDAISGIKDTVFVHASGFTCGAKTYEGIMNLLKQTLGS